MKILIDCSNLNAGGGIQVGLSFINDLNKLDNESINNYLIVLSPNISRAINLTEFKKNIQFIVIPDKNHKNIIRRSLFLRKLEKSEIFDSVFCVFGPSYYKSISKKTVGYAQAQFIYKDSPYFKTNNLKIKFKNFVYSKIKIYLFKKFSDQLIFETNDARNKFLELYKFRKENTFVVNNTLNEIFHYPEKWKKANIDKSEGLKNILVLSANYKHKNLQIIPEVIDALLTHYNFNNFTFYLTINEKELNIKKHHKNHIKFIGKINVNQLPDLYQKMDMLFLPTLLEVFSVTYLEAMYMKIPIITTDLSFSKYICDNAAIYFSPTSPNSAADKIITLINQPEIKNELILNGQTNLNRFGNSLDRTKKYLEIITN
jgi:glycosyltransferase involved in cell wall biosynthesis